MKLMGCHRLPNPIYKLSLVAALLLVTRSAVAQLPTATILGVVKDSSGAVVPDVTLTARNTDTGSTRTTTTEADGSYRVAALPVGTYEVRAEHPGFQTDVRSGLTLTVSEEAVVNLTLQVGAVEQTVAVTAEAPLVDTTSGSLGGLVNEQRVSDLPLNGRNYVDLTLLQPGVVQHKNVSPTTTSQVGLWFSSNGAPVRSNAYMLDGALMLNPTGPTTASLDGSSLGIEGIREFRIITSGFGAEYGMNMGSQMVVVSKGGTNQFHGDVFDFLRNSALDARNFFDYKSAASTRRLPEYERNQFGGAGGGPIVKDKAFFWGAYEGLRDRLGITTIDNVPAAGCHGSGGATITATACPQLGTGAAPVTIAPQMAPLLALFPLPNLGASLFTYPFTQPTQDDFGQMRVDENFGTNDAVFVRYTIEDSLQTNPVSYPGVVQFRNSRNQWATLSENHIFSPVLLNTARFSFGRTRPYATNPNILTDPQYQFIAGQPMGTISIGSVTGYGLSATNPSLKRQNIWTWSDDLVYSRGRHSLKFGTLINRFEQFLLGSTNSRGAVTFTNVGGFLTAKPSQYVALTPGSILYRYYDFSTFGFYAQDDFRVTPTFTLNIGLRYEFSTVPTSPIGIESAVRDIQHDSVGTPGPVWRNPSLHNFSPRFGFAWDVFGDTKTAVRGNFAELYDIAGFTAALNVAASGTPPYSSTTTVVAPPAFTVPFVLQNASSPGAPGSSLRTQDYNMHQPHLLTYNLSFERQLPARTALTVAYAGSRGLNLAETVEGNPAIANILSDGQIFFPATLTRTNPNFGTMEFKTAGGNSWYNSLQVGVTKQLSHNLQFQSSYTYSKVLDETQGEEGAEVFLAGSVFSVWPTRQSIDRAPAVFDLTHVWRLNAIYQLPGVSVGSMAAKLLNGWQASGIWSLESGYPFTPSLQTNQSRSGTSGTASGIDRPNLAPGRDNGNIVSGTSTGCSNIAAGTPLGTPNLYFDPCAFALQSLGFLGNAGRNILRGPGLANLDLSLLKDTPVRKLGETGKLEFRTEVFNILNKANFGMPSATVFNGANLSPTVGQITMTATKSRQIQFALRLLF
jgi:hypothetical protein